MPQRIITMDSQILNTISLCERRTKYAVIDGIKPEQTGEALERGDLMHKMLEVYESQRCNLVDVNSPTWMQLLDETNGMRPPEGDFDVKEYAISAGRFFATKMDLAPEEIEEVIRNFNEYVDFYKDDPWETLAVESVGSKILYEDEDYKFLYTFKIDRFAKRDQIMAPWDYKTSKRRQETSSLSNQFIGYAWATDSNYVIVDKIGFQKTLKAAERFQRIFLSYDQERLSEWQGQAIRWALIYAGMLTRPDDTLMNLTSCDKYGGCVYKRICESSPSARNWIIERDYKVGEKWDPARELEKGAA